VQVVVAPRSRFIGRTIGRIDFLKTLGVVVAGLWRRAGWISDELSQVRLREGDLLVLWGTQRKFSQLAEDRGFLMMVPFAAKERRRHRAAIAIAIIVAVVAAAASGMVAAPIAFLAGAVAMVATGCVAIEQAYREIDVRIYVMIAGVIPLGLAMEKTGVAALLASHLQNITGGWGPRAVLMALFWAAALLTQILSDAATTVLLGPIALALAIALGLPPEPFVVCTALGAVVAFLTPIGHHGNLLILNPGQYTFGDFLRVGVPLTVFISIVSVWLAHALWLA
jgi:di/tricarboxylate transporter